MAPHQQCHYERLHNTSSTCLLVQLHARQPLAASSHPQGTFSQVLIPPIPGRRLATSKERYLGAVEVQLLGQLLHPSLGQALVEGQNHAHSMALLKARPPQARHHIPQASHL